MKKISLLVFGCLVAVAAICQNPLAEVTLKQQQFNNDVIVTIETVHRLWKARKDVQATPGKSYSWKIPGDTAYYFQPVEGKVIKATVTFIEESTTPSEPVLKLTDDDLVATYSTPNLGTNVYTATGWNHFSSLVSPNPTWCNAFHLKTGSFARTAGRTATYTFTGRKIEVLGELSNNKGIAGYQIDNEPEILVDNYAAVGVNNSQVVMSATLPAGQHTLKVTVKGTKRAASSDTIILIDGFRVYE